MEHPKTGDHPVNVPPSVEHRTKTRAELVALCKARGIRGYSGKPIVELVRRISGEDDVLRGNRGITSAQSGSLAHYDAMTAAHDDATTAAHDETTTVATAPPSSGVGTFQMIDLFAGTGAFTLAFQSTNAVRVVFGNDMVESSKAIYDANVAHPLTLQNLHDVAVEAIPPHDILTGGFPCQPFSIAGLREGFNDARSNVFWKIVSIIDHHHPRCVVLENVKNLVGHDEGRTFQTIKGTLEERGYHVCYKVLNTATITGIPQHRERTYMVCLKSTLAFDQLNLEFPTVAKRPIAEFLEADVHPKYYYTEKSSTWELVRANVVKPDTIYQYRRVYVRENKSRECPTLTANMGAGGTTSRSSWMPKGFANLPLPNEDFGRPNKRFRTRFLSTFQLCEYSIWATKR
jgi:DNA (cytosine-5)-methyltransferase 1